jgi:hypothetical protein
VIQKQFMKRKLCRGYLAVTSTGPYLHSQAVFDSSADIQNVGGALSYRHPEAFCNSARFPGRFLSTACAAIFALCPLAAFQYGNPIDNSAH